MVAAADFLKWGLGIQITMSRIIQRLQVEANDVCARAVWDGGNGSKRTLTIE